MRKKPLFIGVLAIIAIVLVLPSFLGSAASQEKAFPQETAIQGEGKATSKDEVIYAVLSATGNLNNMYVVNILEVAKSGTIMDYGRYSSVKNLTDQANIEQVDNKILFDAPVGKFYYQGNMDDHKLPWDFSVSYLLNGKEIAPKELAGKEGSLEIKIQTSPNASIGSTFYENYILQISLLLDSKIYSNIQADKAIIANVGKNKQINFTVLPEQKGSFSITADVVEFEMEGFEIAALPYSMAIDVDVDDMTGDIKTLSDAIQKINNGVAQVKTGIVELDKGAKALNNGSEQFEGGMEEIDKASSQIIEGSKAIKGGLDTLNSSVSGSFEELDLKALESLPKDLSTIGAGLNQIGMQLDTLAKSYSQAHARLDSVMLEIPDHVVTEEDIQGLYNSGANKSVIDKLLETYFASLKARKTYDALKGNFANMDLALSTIGTSVLELSKTMDFISSELSSSLEKMDTTEFSQLEEGIASLAHHYQEFHLGLIGYTEGVSQLTHSYNELHSGLGELYAGTGELEKGVTQLHKGTSKLAKSTLNLPEDMQKEIDNMISDFDKSDFKAVSFVSAENKNINNVQFVIKTESIKKDKVENSIKEEEKPKGFWARLKSLFF